MTMADLFPQRPRQNGRKEKRERAWVIQDATGRVLAITSALISPTVESVSGGSNPTGTRNWASVAYVWSSRCCVRS